MDEWYKMFPWNLVYNNPTYIEISSVFDVILLQVEID